MELQTSCELEPFSVELLDVVMFALSVAAFTREGLLSPGVSARSRSPRKVGEHAGAKGKTTSPAIEQACCRKGFDQLPLE